MYAERLTEKAHNAEFIKSDLGMRSYVKGKVVPTEYFEPGTPVAVLTATKKIARYDNAGTDGTEVLHGFLVDGIRPGFPGEFEVATILHRDAEVFADRVPYPQVLDEDGEVDAVATAALKAALIAEAAALNILFK